MASNGIQVFGFLLGVISWIGMIGTCASPEWRKNTHGQTLIDNTLRYEGLWVRCKAFSTGQTHCDDYNTFFIGLPEVLQVCRALIVASITLGFVAIIITIFGLKCVSVGGGNPVIKARVAIIGGVLFGIAGILSGAAVSYYAHDVVQEYYNPLLKQDLDLYLRFEYGNALFIGWASLVVGILSSSMICSCSAFILFRIRRNPPHIHEFHPVSILQKHSQEPVPLQVFQGGPSSNYSSARHVNIQKQQYANGKYLSSSQNSSNKFNSVTPSSGPNNNEGDRKKRRRRRSYSEERQPRSGNDRPEIYTNSRSNRYKESADENTLKNIQRPIKQYV